MKISKFAAGAVIAFAAAAATNATADQRFAHKQGNSTVDSCGSSSDLSDTTNGPCNSIALAYANAKKGGGGANRIIVMGNGTFQDAVLNIDDTSRPSEIRRTGDGNPAIGGTGSNVAIITVAVGSQRFLMEGLRVIQGQATGTTTGIKVNSANVVELNNVEIRGFGTASIDFSPSGGASSDLIITNANIGTQNAPCVINRPSGQNANVTIRNSLIHHCGNGQGVRSDATNTSSGQFVRVQIVDSIVSNMAAAAVTAVATGAGAARVTVENSRLMYANVGTNANGANASVVLNGSTIMSNGTAIQSLNSGSVFSYGNNVIDFNASAGSAPTVISLK